jgi:O-antigen ligase
MLGVVDFHNAIGYLIPLVVKPLFMVMFGLLVGAAVARSREPERFVTPTVISIWLMCLMLIGFVALSGVGLSQLASSDSRGFLSESLGMHANDLGRLYAFAYALLLFMFAEAKEPRRKVILLASMAVVVSALMLTFSRGAFVGFIVVNLLFLLWRLSARTVLLFIVAAIAMVFLLPDAVYERVTTGFGHGANAVSAGRVEGIWMQLLPEVWRSPILGNGIGSIMWSDFARRAGGSVIVLHPHNAYLQAYFDLGSVGLVLLLGYFVHVWRGFRKLARDAQISPLMRGFFLGAAAGLAGLLVAGLAGSSLMPKPEQAFLWLAIGVMYGYRMRKPGK